MFGFLNKKVSSPSMPLPVGVSEIVICIFDEKHRLLHHHHSSPLENSEAHKFSLLDNPEGVFGYPIFAEAVESQSPSSIAVSFGEGRRKYLYVLPYEAKRGKKRFACMQIQSDEMAGGAIHSSVCTLAEGHVCLLLADSYGVILSASADIPESFGIESRGLKGKNLSGLFSATDQAMISACSPDSGESILSCVLRCGDGTKCDVEVTKHSLPDGCTLYGICDVTRPRLNEEITQVSTRERRRIGQDLHDSIGQLLTGISLLSRSLANSLKRAGHAGDTDAAQISELADDASNQIRQISRGLMPSDIVHRGLMASLQDLARITSDSCGIECDMDFDESVAFADGAVETHLFRIAQEAVNNAVRHANAKRIEIVVCEWNGFPQLEINDDGTWKEIPDNSSGIGMKTMQYRASVIDGHLNVGPSEQGGTTVVCRLEVDELLETKA